jgi:hypothetical protein
MDRSRPGYELCWLIPFSETALTGYELCWLIGTIFRDCVDLLTNNFQYAEQKPSRLFIIICVFLSR